MARRFPTAVRAMLLLVPALVGCASTPATKPVTQAPDQPAYLNGISTEYSVRVDQLADRGTAETPVRMPGALVSRDRAVTTVASLFRVGDHYTLDLILHNMGEEPVEIGRTNVQLIDNAGHTFPRVEDYKGARTIGLRATRRTKETQLAGDDLRLAGARDTGPGVGTTLNQASTKQGVYDPTSGVGAPLPDVSGTEAPAAGVGMTQATRVEEGANVPASVRVPSTQSMPYWVYWDGAGAQPSFPITALVVLGQRRMIFRFEQ